MRKSRAAEGYNQETTDNEAQPKSGRRKIVVALLAVIIVFAAGAALISPVWNWRAAVEQNAPTLIEPSPPSATSEPPAPARSAPEPSAPAEATPANIPEDDREHAASPTPVLKKLDQQQPGISSERDERNVVSDSGAGERCGDVLHRLQLGELLSDEDRTYLQNECGR